MTDELDGTEDPTLQPRDWAALLALSSPPECAAIVERLGADLSAQVRRPLLRREVTAAIKARADAWHGSRSAATAARLDEEADSATSRLDTTLRRMRAAQDEEIEPAVAAVVELCGADLAVGCFAAQQVLGILQVRDVVLHALRGASLDRDVLVELVTAGVGVAEGLQVARALAQYSWWPTRMRHSVVALVKDGADVAEVLRCLSDVAFSRLSPVQQNTALEMIQANGTPYGMDGVRVAATLRGIQLPARSA